MARLSLLFIALVLPAVSLLQPKTGCKKISLLHRGDPADSTSIDGDDCGNVNQIVGKWAKAKKVGELAGAAKSAQLGATQAAKNTDDMVARAKDIDKKVDSVAIKSAVKVAEAKSTAATKAGATLKATTDTFKGKVGNFAKKIEDGDMDKLKEQTQAAIDASDDAMEAAERTMKKALEAKEDAMKDAGKATKLVKMTVSDIAALSDKVVDTGVKSKHAAEDVGDLVTKSKAAATKVDAKIKGAKEQAPVWKAYKDDLEGRAKTATASQKAVTDAIKDAKTAKDDMNTQAKALQGAVDKSANNPKDLATFLKATKGVAGAEEAIRKTNTAMDKLRGKVRTLLTDGERLEAKIKETDERLAK